MQSSNNLAALMDVRLAKAEDVNFILATFLRGLYYGNGFYNLMPKNVFMDNYKQVGTLLLTSKNTKVKMAVLKEDTDIILAYAIMSLDEKTIHWAFCKSAWRNQGITKALISTTPEVYTHFTTLGLKLNQKLNLTFNPFKLT